MKGRITPVCKALLAVLALCLCPPWLAAEERILDYRSDIRVHEDGRINVRERIRVRSEGRDIRRGIYRDFPTRYRDRFGNHVTVEFIPLSVQRNGEPEDWHTQERSNGVRLYAGSADRILQPGMHEYELQFATSRQLGFFESHDELYFNAIGHGWAFAIDQAEVTVDLPFETDPANLTVDVYTGPEGSTGSEASYEILDGNRVRFRTSRPLQPREGMTIAVGWPKGLLAEPGAARKLSWFLADNGAALVLLMGLLAPMAWYAWAWSRVGRDPPEGVIIPRFEPPQGLSPAACRYVADMSLNRNAVTAAIVSLAVKGQLTIEEMDEEFTLQRPTDAPGAVLTAGERAVLDSLLPRPGDRIVMENENYREFREARSVLGKALKAEYHGRLFQLNTIYLAPPALMSVAAAVIAFFLRGGPAIWIGFAFLTLALHGAFMFLMRAPTPAGRIVMDQIEGFRRYLDTGERDRLERMKSPQLTPEVFEAFLPYAYALGVQNSWCQRFTREMPRELRDSGGYSPAWYHGRFDGTGAVYHLGDSFGHSFSSAISSASTPPGSSSGSGGGGFSGGGGGGGGGGGW